MTPFQQHCEKWKNGCGAVICERADRVVVARGHIPCDILFVGEAPGDSENALGRPFVGPAGILLDKIVQEAIGNRFRRAFVNVVGCIPLEEDGSKSTDGPDLSSVKKCLPRLVELVGMAAPRLVICVGSLANGWIRNKRVMQALGLEQTPIADILHPAYILRSNLAQQGLLIQKTVINLLDAVEEHLENGVDHAKSRTKESIANRDSQKTVQGNAKHYQ